MSVPSVAPNPDAGLYTGRHVADRSPRGHQFIDETQVLSSGGMYNDGIGHAYRDTNVAFAGLPSLRLDTEGITGVSGQPQTMAPSGTVIVKRRVGDNFSGKFAAQCRVRWTSSNSACRSTFCISNYNRSSSWGEYGRLWLDTTGDNNTGVQGLGYAEFWQAAATVSNTSGGLTYCPTLSYQSTSGMTTAIAAVATASGITTIVPGTAIFTATWSANATTMTVTGGTAALAGATVSGTGIPTGTYIISMSGTTATLSSPALGSIPAYTVQAYSAGALVTSGSLVWYAVQAVPNATHTPSSASTFWSQVSLTAETSTSVTVSPSAFSVTTGTTTGSSEPAWYSGTPTNPANLGANTWNPQAWTVTDSTVTWGYSPTGGLGPKTVNLWVLTGSNWTPSGTNALTGVVSTGSAGSGNGTGTTTWVKVGQAFNQGTDEHAYRPGVGYYDKAGLWHFAEVGHDFANHVYTHVCFNDTYIDLTAANIPCWRGPAASQSIMHFSVEYGIYTQTGNTTVAAVNVADFHGKKL